VGFAITNEDYSHEPIDREASRFRGGSYPNNNRCKENNNDMLRYFLRAARLAKIEVNIENLVPNLSSEDKSTVNMIVH